MKKLKFDYRKYIKDPMVLVLASMLVFLTVGTSCVGCASKKITIELDAAYGGDNTGYTGIINEADFTQNVVDQLYALLSKDSHYEVLLTHESGESSSVDTRVEKIKADKADMVLSIHADGVPDETVSGMSIYADTPTAKTNKESLKFANTISAAFTSDTWTPSVGYLYYTPLGDNYQIQTVTSDDTKDYDLDTWDMMVKLEDIPVVIADQIHVTNQSDVDTWANEEGYAKAAELYYEAIKAYYGQE